MSPDDALTALRTAVAAGPPSAIERARTTLVLSVRERLAHGAHAAGLSGTDAEDVAQEHADRTTSEIMALDAAGELDSATGYATTKGRMRGIDHWRRQKVRPGSFARHDADGTALERTATGAPSPEEAAQQAELRAAIVDCIERMDSAVNRTTWLRVHVEGESVEKVAWHAVAEGRRARSGQRPTYEEARNRVYKQLQRAREALRDCLERKGIDGTTSYSRKP